MTAGLLLAMLFGLLAIGMPVAFTLVFTGSLGLYLVGGWDAMVGVLSTAQSGLDAALADKPATTYIPWQGWALATDDFLVTRLMEMVVHSDDLAASVDVPTPDFGSAVLDPVLRLLTSVSLRRHGQDALVRTLSRPQRAPGSVSAF